MSLKKKAKSSLLWTVLESVFVKSFTFIVTLVLTRLLSPEDFGLIGLITIFVALGTVIVESGMGTSIIRDSKSNDVDYSTVFYANLLISILLYILVYFAAPYIAAFFESALLVDLIRVYSISFIIAAFFNIQQNLLMKELAFKKLTILTIPGIIIGSLIGLGMAYLGYGVWSIVALHISTQTIKALVIWIKSGWRPKWVFSTEKLKYHINFGYKLMFSAVLNTIFNELYTVIIGKKFSVTALGYYSQAKVFKNYPVQFTTSILTKVSYPLLSKIKDDKEKISSIYQSILKTVFFCITFLMFGLAVIAKPLFLVLFSEKWIEAAPYFQILAISSILTPIHAFNIDVFKVFGRTDLFLKLEFVKITLVLISVFIGLYFGIEGLLWSIVISSYLALLINTNYSGAMINYKTIQQLKDMFPVLVIGFLSWFLSDITMNFMIESSNILLAFCGFITFTIVYLGLSFIIKVDSFKQTIKFVLFFLKKDKIELTPKEN